jgi:IMP and pyridine-specific 5'-nucleotidase
VPFVLHSQPTAAYEDRDDVLTTMASTAHKRYAEILHDVECLINDHLAHQRRNTIDRSKLKLLVPGVGIFFTPLLLVKAFEYQDKKRRISSRRFVPPSFNDIRLILNSAQVLGLIQSGPLELVTFDGDVTLYADGHSLDDDNPVIPRIVDLLTRGTKVAIVTAAGYTDRSKYYGRLHGLLVRLKKAVDIKELVDPELIILGGESSYLFAFDPAEEYFLKYVRREDWILPQMKDWTDENITTLLDVAEKALRECIANMQLSAEILRKERAVGIIPSTEPGSQKFTREQLEETVLVTQQIVEMSPVAKKLPFCAFNGDFALDSFFDSVH